MSIYSLEAPRYAVHLWWLFIDDTRDMALIDRYCLLLTSEELERSRHFQFNKDRHHYLVTRAMVRTVLSRYAPIAPQQWRFEPDSYGRPTIVNECQIARAISFNVSHTDGLVVLALTSGGAVGVDTEPVLRGASARLASHHFTTDELLAMQSLAPSLRGEHVLELWTLKESYVKACGLGLSMGLSKIGFELDQDRIGVSFEGAPYSTPDGWHFWQMHPSNDYLAALGFRKHGSCSTPIELVSWRVVPLRSEQLMDCAVFRNSVQVRNAMHSKQ